MPSSCLSCIYAFLTFQLHTHADEFESLPRSRRQRYARRNTACRSLWWYWITTTQQRQLQQQRRRNNNNHNHRASTVVERVPFLTLGSQADGDAPHHIHNSSSSHTNTNNHNNNHKTPDEEEACSLAQSSMDSSHNNNITSMTAATTTSRRRRKPVTTMEMTPPASPRPWKAATATEKSKTSETWEDLNDEDDDEEELFVDEDQDFTSAASPYPASPQTSHYTQNRHGRNREAATAADNDTDLHRHDDDDDNEETPQLSMRMGIVWLLILTLCISSMSDILVDSIDDFAQSMRLSEVFTSMVIIPFFSNVAEQVSAFIFAYRNEMDLCVAVTIGSAVQIATFVLPGSVLIGMTLDRSMTLYFGAYETCCLFFAVVVIGAVLQSGTSNWLTGCMLVGIYLMFASGIWFHELEELTVDGESKLWKGRNQDAGNGQ